MKSKIFTLALTVLVTVLFIFNIAATNYTITPYKTTYPIDFNTQTATYSLLYDPNRFVIRNHMLYLLDANYPGMSDFISHAGLQTSLADMNSNSVGTSQIVDGSVSAADINNLAVTNGKLAASAVTTVKIADSNITTSKILDGVVSLADMNSNSVNSAKIVDDTIVSADVASSLIKVETVTVTGPNVLTLYSDPKALVAAPGTHNVIEFLGATILYDYAGAAYGGEDVNIMSIKYKANASGAAVSSTLAGTGFLTATADRVAKLIPAAVAATAAADIENQPLVLYMAAADPNDGVGSAAAGVLRVRISYRIHPSGF